MVLLRSWMRKILGQAKFQKMRKRREKVHRPQIEQLENRLTPASYTWAGGTGNWDTSTANWLLNGTGTPTTWVQGSDAVFAGTAGTITTALGISANSITFDVA